MVFAPCMLWIVGLAQRSLVGSWAHAVVAALLCLCTVEARADDVVDVPRVALESLAFEVQLPAGAKYEVRRGAAEPTASGTSDGAPLLVHPSNRGELVLAVKLGQTWRHHSIRVLPAWMSLVPALLAILLAFLLRQVIPALALGVFSGVLMLEHFAPWQAFARFLDQHLVDAVADRGHATILLFSLLLGGMIGLITRSGGGLGLANWVAQRAVGRRSGQLVTWFLGLLIFFDDYANSLLIGSSMRPITDRLRISREKLAFLVDATAAPVASLAIISSWVAVEVGYIRDQFDALGIESDAYLTFLRTIPFRFYPILMLVFVFWMAVRGRDFGPMFRAEERATATGEVLRQGAMPAADFEEIATDVQRGRSSNAIFPILVVVLTAVVGMYMDGRAKLLAAGEVITVRDIFGSASSSNALLWAAATGCLAAFFSASVTRALRPAAALDAWLKGIRSMLLACIILVMAWALGDICEQLHTAGYLVQILGKWIAPGMVPAAVFCVAALVSFATGTSWGTMAILFPLVVPLAHQIAPGHEEILLGTISSILAGAVWGDHCSPISDTTILSSMATSCDHIDHVRTQLPYAMLVGVVSVFLGDVAVGMGVYPAWAGLVLGALLVVIMLELFGRRVVPYKARQEDAISSPPTS